MSVDGWHILGLHGLGWLDLGQLALHFMLLSMLAVGGAITTAPDMQRYLVHDRSWLSVEQFSASVAIAQAAPGPNILFVALVGLNVAGLAGMLATMGGMMLPSSVLALNVGRYGRRRADSRLLRAFTSGLAPLTVGLLLSTGWVLAWPGRSSGALMALVAGSALAMINSRVGPLWLMAVGAGVGMWSSL